MNEVLTHMQRKHRFTPQTGLVVLQIHDNNSLLACELLLK